MKVIGVTVVILVGTFCCSASQQAQSSTSSHEALAHASASTQQVDLIAEADALLKSIDSTSTLPLRRLIKALKADRKKGGSPEGIAQIILCINSLRIKWAKVLLESATKAVQPNVIDPDELIECIEQLAPAIGSGLVPVQQIWDAKESREKKWRTVESTLAERQQEIDYARAEEKKWMARREVMHNEIKQAPDTLPADLLQLTPQEIVKKVRICSSQKEVAALQMQGHLNATLTQLEQCKDKAVDALKPLPESWMGVDNDDDDEYREEQVEAVSYINQAVDETYAILSRRVVWDVKSELREQEDPQTLEEIQNEYADLMAELRDRGDIAVHAVQEYRKLYERLQSNRKLYSEHRLVETGSFTQQHASLQTVHVEHVLLRARLKLLLPLAQRTRKQLCLQQSEISLLEHHKEDFSPQERDALSIINPTVWMRFKGLFV